ncbi:MAG: hypothetical protein JRI55_01825 [Deltaproteobacteria bacterium]|nr:hypothetical protein [Deltaproteobacteria bacterium]
MRAPLRPAIIWVVLLSLGCSDDEDGVAGPGCLDPGEPCDQGSECAEFSCSCVSGPTVTVQRCKGESTNTCATGEESCVSVCGADGVTSPPEPTGAACSN